MASENSLAEQEKKPENSYSQILKSTSIVGGAQVINMAIGLVRTKLVAILIGPSGVGLLGIYQSITGLTSTLAGLGIQTSGVRDVAKSHGNGDHVAIAHTVITLRRISWFTGIVGCLLLAALSPLLSQMSFGSQDYAGAISLLGLTIFFGNITGGQSAILQGTRRIGDLARISIWGALLSTIVSIAFYALLGTNGIVPSLVVISAIGLCISTYYARKIELEAETPSWKETWQQAKSLIAFGLALVLTGVLTAAVSYAIRILVTQQHGLVGAGIYSAAFSLSGLFVQFVLTAMGTDFYPRLTAEANDNARMTQLTNEQTEIGLLLAFPGLLATLALAPILIALFYTQEFATASELLKWFIIGCMGRVLSWPLGFSLLAKGQGGLFMLTETLFNVLHIAIVWLFTRWFGLNGVAIGFAALYAAYTLGMLVINRKTIAFTWSKGVWSQLAWMTPIAAICFSLSHLFTEIVSGILGTCIAAASCLICLRQLSFRLGSDNRITRIIQSLPGGKWMLFQKSTNLSK